MVFCLVFERELVFGYRNNCLKEKLEFYMEGFCNIMVGVYGNIFLCFFFKWVYSYYLGNYILRK